MINISRVLKNSICLKKNDKNTKRWTQQKIYMKNYFVNYLIY